MIPWNQGQAEQAKRKANRAATWELTEMSSKRVNHRFTGTGQNIPLVKHQSADGCWDSEIPHSAMSVNQFLQM